MALTAFAAALLTAAAAPAAAATTALPAEEPQFAASILVAGEAQQAIAALKHELAFEPANPALLINLGVAYAQAGDIARARAAFRDAARASAPMQVVIADGTQTDSRSLARRGLRILEGERYALAAEALSRMSLRD